MTRRSTTNDLSSVASWEPSAPRAATGARPACRLLASRHHATTPRYADSRNARIAGSVRSYRRQAGLHLRDPVGSCDAWNGVDPARDRPDARKRQAYLEPDRHRSGDARGLEVSLGGLFQDQLVQGQIRNRLAETLVLLLQTLQFLHLIRTHPAVLATPAIIGLLYNANLADRVQTGHALTHKNLDLAKLGDDFFRCGTLLAHLRSSVSLNITVDHFAGGGSAEFETNLRKERQMEGIAKAKERGVYKGRRPSIDVEKVRELKESGMGGSQIAKELGISRASVYRVLSS